MQYYNRSSLLENHEYLFSHLFIYHRIKELFLNSNLLAVSINLKSLYSYFYFLDIRLNCIFWNVEFGAFFREVFTFCWFSYFRPIHKIEKLPFSGEFWNLLFILLYNSFLLFIFSWLSIYRTEIIRFNCC